MDQGPSSGSRNCLKDIHVPDCVKSVFICRVAALLFVLSQHLAIIIIIQHVKTYCVLFCFSVSR